MKNMNKKNLIICFHPYSLMGGATIKMTQLLNGLDKRNFEIVYLYIKKNCQLNLNKNIKIIKINSSRTLLSFFKIKKILSVYNKKKFNKKIYISNQNYSNILTFFLIKDFQKYKTILIERNHLDELNYYESFKDYCKKTIIKKLMKLTYKNATVIVGNTKKLSKDLSYFVNSEVKTIYSPTNSKEVLKLSRSYLPTNIKKNKSRIRLLSVSRFTKRKDLITLLKAFFIISSKFSTIDLILIGYGPELNNINNFIKKNNLSKRVFVLPPKKNPFPYFLISDLYVMPSLYEGCPNSIIEAILLNLPVISSDCNTGPSEILLNGKGGFIFKKKDASSLANKIKLFMKNKEVFNKKLKIAKKGIYRFEEKNIIKQYNDLLNII